jgi:hypothetical protein
VVQHLQQVRPASPFGGYKESGFGREGGVQLAEEPRQGTALGKGCYKVRMRIASKGRGKSGGARLITCVRIVGNVVWLLTIYDKSEKASVTDKELSDLVSRIT